MLLYSGNRPKSSSSASARLIYTDIGVSVVLFGLVWGVMDREPRHFEGRRDLCAAEVWHFARVTGQMWKSIGAFCSRKYGV